MNRFEAGVYAGGLFVLILALAWMEAPAEPADPLAFLTQSASSAQLSADGAMEASQ